MTAEELRKLAAQAGLELRPGSEEEMAAVYERLQALAQRVRAAQAEPAHIFLPPK